MADINFVVTANPTAIYTTIGVLHLFLMLLILIAVSRR
jgi:hypothetical protein